MLVVLARWVGVTILVQSTAYSLAGELFCTEPKTSTSDAHQHLAQTTDTPLPKPFPSTSHRIAPLIPSQTALSPLYGALAWLATMLVTDEEAADLKTWVVKKLEDMCVAILIYSSVIPRGLHALMFSLTQDNALTCLRRE